MTALYIFNLFVVFLKFFQRTNTANNVKEERQEERGGGGQERGGHIDKIDNRSIDR